MYLFEVCLSLQSFSDLRSWMPPLDRKTLELRASGQGAFRDWFSAVLCTWADVVARKVSFL